MNILIIGQNTKIANVFKQFADNIYMVIDYSFPNYRAYKENAFYNIISTHTDIKKPANIFQRCFEIKKWTITYDIDIIFTNEKHSMIAAKIASKLINKPVILLSTSHNSYAWINHKNVTRFSKLINLTTNGYVSLASFVYKQLISNHIPERKLLLLPNTIEAELFTQKKSFNIDTNNIKLIYTATIYYGKAQDTIIKAIKLLAEKNIYATVDFYGDTIDSSYKKELEKLIVEYNLSNQVSFKGRIDNENLRKHLPLYDIYICPSRMEMSPLNILEAKASKLPIIATNVGGIPDLIRNNYDGLLINPDSPKQLSETIIKLIHEPILREKIATEAYNNVTYTNNALSAGDKLSAFIQQLK